MTDEFKDMQLRKDIEARLALVAAMPKTHKVVTTYADGRVREFETRSLVTAKNHAVLDQRNIGRGLIDRDTGKIVVIKKVEIKEIKPNA